jgi:hypothetical protein
MTEETTPHIHVETCADAALPDDEASVPPSKKDLLKTLNALIELETRNASASLWFMIFYARKSERLSPECMALKKRVLETPDDADAFPEITDECCNLKLRMNENIAQARLFSVIAGMYVAVPMAMGIIYLIYMKTGISGIFGIDLPPKLIAYSILGAFVYLSTLFLAPREKEPEQGNLILHMPASPAANFPARLFLALAVPVVLVGMFLDGDGNLKTELEATPELLSFGCGYSAKLVVDVFNKLVEKASKMIEAL